MSNNKSKLPELNEIANAATKIFRDLTRSVKEICQDYKAKRAKPGEVAEEKKPTAKTTKKTAKKE